MVFFTHHRRHVVYFSVLLVCTLLNVACTSSTKEQYYAIATKSAHRLTDADLKVLHSEAEKGNPSAMYRLSRWAYFKNDYEYSARSYEWEIQAAESGLATAMLSVGFNYLSGSGIERDVNKSFYWLTLYSKLSEYGDTFGIKQRNEAMQILDHEEQAAVLEEVNRDIEIYRIRWKNFCKEYDQDPMC